MSDSKVVDRSIHLVATGERARMREAAACALHLRKMGYQGDIAVHTDRPEWEQIAEHTGARVLVSKRPEGYTAFQMSREIRTTLCERTCAELNLMLDTDMAAIKDPWGIWDQLGDKPYGMCRDRFTSTYSTLVDANELYGTQEEWGYMREHGYVSLDVPTFNGGLMLWRTCTKSAEWFHAWRQEWLRFKDRDQQAMSRALKDHPEILANLQEIDQIWNRYVFNMRFFKRNPPKRADEIVFVHCHIAAKDVYKEEWKQAKELVKVFGD